MLGNISKSNNSFIAFLENPVVKYSILILLTLLIIVIDKINIHYLELFDNDMFKLIYTLLIVYTACFDPIYSIIMTTFIIMVIQELHTRKATIGITNEKHSNRDNRNNKHNRHNRHNNSNDVNTNNIVFVESKITEEVQPTQSVMYENNVLPSETTLTNIRDSQAIINKQSLQKHPKQNDTLIVDYDYYEDPAFKTLTHNLQEKNRLNKNKFLVTEDDLVKAQTNKQPNMKLTTAEIKLCDIQGYNHLEQYNTEF